MGHVVSKDVRNLYNGKVARVTLDDGREGVATSGGFFKGSSHEAVTRATRDANSKPVPKKSWW
jgi:hypothetical protein